VREPHPRQGAATRITEPMFTINWHFLSGTEVESAEIEEIADAEPAGRGVSGDQGWRASFIERYLDAKETILVLQGPPGTGQDAPHPRDPGRDLAPQGEGEEAQVLYTGDMKALRGDQIFVKFITGWDDAFVVEDADHMLKPRSDGTSTCTASSRSRTAWCARRAARSSSRPTSRTWETWTRR
jgi:hypothetical protein